MPYTKTHKRCISRKGSIMYYRNLPVDCLHAVGLASNVRSRKEQNGNVPAKNMTQESPKSTYPLVGSLGVQVHRKHAH